MDHSLAEAHFLTLAVEFSILDRIDDPSVAQRELNHRARQNGIGPNVALIHRIADRELLVLLGGLNDSNIGLVGLHIGNVDALVDEGKRRLLRRRNVGKAPGPRRDNLDARIGVFHPFAETQHGVPDGWNLDPADGRHFLGFSSTWRRGRQRENLPARWRWERKPDSFRFETPPWITAKEVFG